nr:hypothetical protein CFP56_21981 [Quercus suber]
MSAPSVTRAAKSATYHQPIHAFVHSPAIDRAARHDAPIPVLQLAQLQCLADIPRALGAGLILFIRKDQQRSVAQLLLVEHGAQLAARGAQALDVGAVDDKDDGGRVAVVAAPVWPDARLPAEVPHVEGQVAVRDALDVEPDGRDRGHDLADLQPVQQCRLAGVVQPEDQDAELFLRPDQFAEEGEGASHGRLEKLGLWPRQPRRVSYAMRSVMHSGTQRNYHTSGIVILSGARRSIAGIS